MAVGNFHCIFHRLLRAPCTDPIPAGNLSAVRDMYGDCETVYQLVDTWGLNKMATFCRRQFQMHFLELKLLYFYQNFIVACSYASNLQLIRHWFRQCIITWSCDLGSGNQLVPNRWYTVKPVYNDHLMGYFSAFWSSSRWPRPPRWAPGGRNC